METLDQERLAVLREVMTHFDVLWQFDYASTPVHAVFDFSESDDGKTYRCTVTHMNQALRLSVQALLEGDAGQDRLRRLDELNAQWGMGRIYLDRSHGHFDVAAGLYLGAGVPGKHLLRETLSHLLAAGDSIRKSVAPTFRPHLQASPPRTLASIEEVLKSQGLQPSKRDDRDVLGLRLALSPQLDFVLEYQINPDQLLKITAIESNPISLLEDDSAYAHLQDINRGLNFGSMLFDRGNGRFLYSMTIPLGWFEFDAELARWVVRQSASVITQLQREERP